MWNQLWPWIGDENSWDIEDVRWLIWIKYPLLEVPSAIIRDFDFGLFHATL